LNFRLREAIDCVPSPIPSRHRLTRLSTSRSTAVMISSRWAKRVGSTSTSTRCPTRSTLSIRCDRLSSGDGSVRGQGSRHTVPATYPARRFVFKSNNISILQSTPPSSLHTHYIHPQAQNGTYRRSRGDLLPVSASLIRPASVVSFRILDASG
jgi:hypothetical protein